MVEIPNFEKGEDSIAINKSIYCAKCMSEMKSIRKKEFQCEHCGQKYIEKE